MTAKKTKGNVLAIIAAIMLVIDYVVKLICYALNAFGVHLNVPFYIEMAAYITLIVALFMRKKNVLLAVGLGLSTLADAYLTIERFIEIKNYSWAINYSFYFIPQIIHVFIFASLLLISIIIIVNKNKLPSGLWLLPVISVGVWFITICLIDHSIFGILSYVFSATTYILISLWLGKAKKVKKVKAVEKIDNTTQNTPAPVNTPTTMFCRSCGTEIPQDSAFCPVCGKQVVITQGMAANNSIAPANIVKSKVRLIQKIQPKWRAVISACLAIATLVFVIVGITTLTSDDYSFYKNHYEDCMDEYWDCKKEAITSGWYFSSIYENLADDFKKMADDNQATLVGMVVKSVIFFVFAGVFVVGFFIFLPPKNSLKSNSSNVSSAIPTQGNPPTKTDDNNESEE